MFQVSDVFEEGKKIVGSCADDIFLRWATDAVNMVINKSAFEGFKGWLDICTSGQGRCITLPREVGTVLAVNIGGQPTLGRDQFFSFHINGPGDCRGSCSYSWDDQGSWHSVYKDLVTPSRLVAHLQKQSDNGKELLVFGYDVNNHPLRRQVNGEWRDGYQVPTIYGYAIPDVDAPVVSRITAVQKAVTDGVVRLATSDSGGLNGVNLAVYEPRETLPQYRRIKLGRTCSWVRIAYRKSSPKIESFDDHIPMLSRMAFLLALRAVKFYSEQDLANAHAYEADAARMEIEAQQQIEPPTMMPIQVVDWNLPQDKGDYGIS